MIKAANLLTCPPRRIAKRRSQGTKHCRLRAEG